MKFVDPLTQSDFQLLYETRRASSVHRTRDRAHAVLLSDKGYKINNIADIFDIDRDTVSAWLDAWKNNGEEGLSDKPHTGRPSLLTTEDTKRLEALIAERPHQSKEVHVQLSSEINKKFSRSTMIRALKKSA